MNTFFHFSIKWFLILYIVLLGSTGIIQIVHAQGSSSSTFNSTEPLPIYTKPNIFKPGSTDSTKFFDQTDANKLPQITKPLYETLPPFIINTLFGLFTAFGTAISFYAGYQIVFSKGDQKKLQEGIQTLVYAVLGLMIVGGAWMVIRLVLNISFGG